MFVYSQSLSDVVFELKTLERVYHAHIKSGYDIIDKKAVYIVFDYSWKRRFKAYSLKGLRKGLYLFKTDFENVYSKWGFDFEY